MNARWLLMLVMLGGCGTQAMDPSVDVAAASNGWSVYAAEGVHPFALQTTIVAVVANGADAAGQCRANSARLPTTAEWAVVEALDFDGVSRPHFPEWCVSRRGRLAVCTFGLPATYIGFRCASNI